VVAPAPALMSTELPVLPAAWPTVKLIPPASDPNERPLAITTTPLLPLELLPLDSTTLPDVPLDSDTPEATYTSPVFPLPDVPLLNTMLPDATPFPTTFDDRNSTLPDVFPLPAPDPLATTMLPPLFVVDDPPSTYT